MSAVEGMTLTPGGDQEALESLEKALLQAPMSAFADLRLSLVLKDGRKLDNLMIRAAMKIRDKRGDAMVDCIDQIRLDRADAPGTPSLWVRFSDIAEWGTSQ